MIGFKHDVIRLLEKKRDAYEKAGDVISTLALTDIIREVNRMGCFTCAWCENGYCMYFMPSEEVDEHKVCGQYTAKE